MSATRTLLFCTSYTDRSGWDRRYRRWIKAVTSSGLHFDQALIVDDGSPALPDWADTDIVTDEATTESRAPLAIYHHRVRLGRNSVLDFPGWYRSFAFAAKWAQSGGFNRIIHIESDAFLITSKAVDYFNGVKEGWVSMFCAKYDMPESALQIMAGSGYLRYIDYVSRSYDHLRNRSHEKTFPFTHVERGLIGDRYGDFMDHVPDNADWVANTKSRATDLYFWWIDSNLTMHFGKRRLRPNFLLSGWCQPEDRFTWTGAKECSFGFLAPKLPSDHVLILTCKPMLHGRIRSYQRVFCSVNGHYAGGFIVRGAARLEVYIPWSQCSGSDRLVVSLRLPDAMSPAEATGTSTDRRLLGIALFTAELVAVDGHGDPQNSMAAATSPPDDQAF